MKRQKGLVCFSSDIRTQQCIPHISVGNTTLWGSYSRDKEAIGSTKMTLYLLSIQCDSQHDSYNITSVWDVFSASDTCYYLNLLAIFRIKHYIEKYTIWQCYCDTIIFSRRLQYSIQWGRNFLCTLKCIHKVNFIKVLYKHIAFGLWISVHIMHSLPAEWSHDLIIHIIP